MDLIKLLDNLIPFFSRSALAATLVVAAFTAGYAIIAALRSGILRRVRIAGIELEMPELRRTFGEEAAGEDIKGELPSQEPPFESTQLAKYYAQVLAQSRVSFWFSLIFAALGFAVIIASAMLYSSERSGATVASFVAGVIVDAVAALFFVQSRDAQRAMSEFFDKLRRDRESLESRRIMETIEAASARDALRLHMALHLAGIADSSVAGSILDRCLSREAPGSIPASAHPPLLPPSSADHGHQAGPEEPASH